MESLILAGLGYDHATHTIKPQVLKSTNFQKVEPIRETNTVNTLSNAQQLFSMIYPNHDGSSKVYNGLYSHNEGVDLIFSKYFQGEFTVYNSQKQFVSHHVESEGTSIVSGFEKIIEFLPGQYDADLYNLVLSYFGDSVLTSVDYGGVVDLTSSVRSCFSDGRIQQFVQSELSDIVGQAAESMPDSYARYHKVSQMDIIGGNPEISDIRQRIPTFSANPVPTFFTTIPIWQVFPAGSKRENMKYAYDKFMASRSSIISDMVNRMNTLQQQESQQAIQFKSFGRNRNGILVDIGTVNLGLGQKAVISAPRCFYKTTITELPASASINLVRNGDQTFQFNALCSARNGFGQTIVDQQNSQLGKGSCVSVGLPVPQEQTVIVGSKNQWGKVLVGWKYPDITEVIVCGGCQAFISGDGRGISCHCPFVQ